MDEITELHENLFIGDADTVSELPVDHQFNEVVTLGYVDMFGNEYPDASTTKGEFKFRDGPHDYQVFASAANYVIDTLQADNSILVHCQAAVSRSPGICIAIRL